MTDTTALKLADWMDGLQSINPLDLSSVSAELRRLATMEAERNNLRAELDQLRRDHDSRGGMLELTRARRDELEAENDALRADAERYRWLRNRVFKDGGDLGIQVAGAYDNFVGGSMADGFDAAIDAARTQSKTQEKP